MKKNQIETSLMKPTQYAEHNLVVSILNGIYPPGTTLPSERVLSNKLGVTRQTLREVLQRLAKDRWIVIQHGKATIVNNYWLEGGMGILKTMVEYTDFLPDDFISHLLEVRVIFLPICAKKSVSAHSNRFLEFLKTSKNIEDNSRMFAEYDWELQKMMVRNTDNIVYPLFLNDFEPIFDVLGEAYFTQKKAREVTKRYYAKLLKAICTKKDVEPIVRYAMNESITIWKEFKLFEGKRSNDY